MPYDIRVIRGRDFIRLDATGHLDLETSRALLSDAIWACVRTKVCRVLIDVREAKSTDLSIAKLGALVQVCQEISPPDDEHRIAILNRPKDETDRAAAVAAAAQETGWNIQSFRDFEDSFAWLSDSP